ncbi:MAG TPA: SPOR domain-containing protein [Steroidobacteraceae bacterium]
MPRLTTRDYKRSSRSSSAARLKEFGLGVLVGAVLASAAFLIAGAHARHRAAAAAHTHSGGDSQSDAPHAPAPDDTSSDNPDNPGAAATSGAAVSPQSAPTHTGAHAAQYDFYRMLPSFKVPVPHDDEHPSHAPPPVANQPQHAAASGSSYVLQVGSYRSTAEAEQVRARLARAGISAQVQRIVQGSRTWNRVRIGPLSDAELAKVRGQLRTANLHALLIRSDR